MERGYIILGKRKFPKDFSFFAAKSFDKQKKM